MKKVTLQDVADRLQTSRVTVWKVLSGRPGVAESLRKKVISTALEMGYKVPEDLIAGSDSTEKAITISLAVSRPETSTFWMNTIHEIAKESATKNINMIYTYLPTNVTEDYILPSSLMPGQTQGIIVLNVYNDILIKQINALPIPKIFMDVKPNIPFKDINGDLLLIEGKSPIEEITKHIINSGRKEIGFIGDIEYAQTNFERFYGFKNAMRDLNVPINQSFLFTSEIGKDSYKEEIEAYLNSLKKMPQAFICVSDFVANIVIKALLEKGLRIPEDVMVSGFDLISDFDLPIPLTSVRVNNTDMGSRLANKLIYRINHPKSGNEVSYIFPEVVFKDSTQV